MIKAVLLDLDDTLITTNTDVFFPDYVTLMAKRMTTLAPETTILSALRLGVRAASITLDPLTTTEESFMATFLGAVDCPYDEVSETLKTFYIEDFPKLRERVSPRPKAIQLLDWLFEHDYTVVVATNPMTPETAIEQRMSWAQIPVGRYPFALITTLETMHFAKPNAEYYEEILARVGARPDESIMIGDHRERDIEGAIAAGLNTFWINDKQQASPKNSTAGEDGQGTLDAFVNRVLSGWLDALEPPPRTRDALLYGLAAMPAAIDALLRSNPKHIIVQRPSENEWSVQDVISHLGCHELAEDRLWLERILTEENPFISATHSQQTHEPRPGLPYEDLQLFARLRSETVAWLKGLPDEAWKRRTRHSIFGPTSFEEMIGFMVEHDRIHLRQMHVALENICGNLAR